MTTTNSADPARTVEHVDPNSIVLDTNVRTDARLDKQFVASIREHGVMQPVVGYRDEDGTIRVQQGQRRTLGAIEAGRVTIPVYLAASPDEAQRIITQMIENDQRAGFTDAERAEGYEQLSLLGLSAAQIARQVHTPKKHIEQSLTARGSDLGRDSLTAGYTIDQAATLADLGTDQESVDRLANAAQRNQFDHEAQRIRDERETADKVAEQREALTGQGITVLDETPWAYYYDGRGEAAPLSALDVESDDHGNCPGAAAVVTSRWGGEVAVTYLCTAWKANGHTNHRADTTASGPMTEEEKAQRRTIIENNKAWRAATTVCREWLTEFSRRKSAPKDTASFLAECLARAGASVQDGMNDRQGITTELLGDNWRQATPAASPRALVRAASIALAGFEVQYADVHTWRTPNGGARLYLRTLAAWGYTPSDLEQTLLVEPSDDPAPEVDSEE